VPVDGIDGRGANPHEHAVVVEQRPVDLLELQAIR
jgi:hypothetical protein